MNLLEKLLLTYKTSRTNRLLWFALAICISVLALNEIYLLYLRKSYPAEYIEAQFQILKTRYGIRIVYEINDAFLSPLKNSIIPAGPGRESKVTPIRHRVLLAYPPILLRAFEKYPIEVIDDHLSSIHFAEKINEGGFYYGGAYDPFRKIIYLADNGCKNDDLMEYTFHHEFSSLLLKSRSLILNQWFNQNPKNFTYIGERKKASSENFTDICSEADEKIYKEGFLTCYGQTYFENDFNEYSAMIFTYPHKVKRIIQRYPRVRGKFLVWLKFYNDIDPIFTEDYFFDNIKQKPT